MLDQYYVPTRYPNGLAGGVPFEAFGASGRSDWFRLAVGAVGLDELDRAGEKLDRAIGALVRTGANAAT